MYKFRPIFAAIVAVILCACSSNDDEVEEQYYDYDMYGVAKWDNPDDFTLIKYYTLVDTITLKTPHLSLIVKTTDGNIPVMVDWRIGDNYYESVHMDETLGNAPGITVSTYYPYLPESFEYTGKMEVSATAQVAKNTIKRESAIEEQAHKRDVLYVNFGMTIGQVKGQVERLRGEGKFNLREDGIGYENIAPHFLFGSPGKTLYIFNKYDMLHEVVEFPYSIYEEQTQTRTGSLNSAFVEFCRRLEIPYEIELTEEGTLAREYEWEREGILLSLVLRDDVFPIDEETAEYNEPRYMPNSIGISYRRP